MGRERERERKERVGGYTEGDCFKCNQFFHICSLCSLKWTKPDNTVLHKSLTSIVTNQNIHKALINALTTHCSH